MKNGFVRFKGIADGVCICLDSSVSMYELLDELENKINLNRSFFGEGGCRIVFSGRTLTVSEKDRLTGLISRLMPLARIEYDQPKKDRRDMTEWINKYKGKKSDEERKTTAETTETIGETEPEKSSSHLDVHDEEFLSKFRSTRAELYQCILHDGASLKSDGHLILMGTAEKGSSLSAVGDIIVIGGLYGSAHAGCHGHNGSYIIAMDMQPETLAIADAVYTPPEETEEIMEETEEKRGFFGRKRKKAETVPESEDLTQNKPYSAIALCKNHKIILDNFTIKTFTNPKNMI